jgi:hypothetical protein
LDLVKLVRLGTTHWIDRDSPQSFVFSHG